MEGREMLTGDLQGDDRASECDIGGMKDVGGLQEWIAREFSSTWLDEVRCRTIILGWLHKGEAQCPRCHAELDEKRSESFWLNERVQCSVCDRYFTALTDTIFSGTRLSFAAITLMLFLIADGKSAASIAQRVGIDATSVRTWRRKLKIMEHTA